MASLGPNGLMPSMLVLDLLQIPGWSYTWKFGEVGITKSLFITFYIGVILSHRKYIIRICEYVMKLVKDKCDVHYET